MFLAADDGVGFWDLFWLFFIFMPLIFLWVFAFVDIFRRDDLGGAMMAVWAMVVLILPVIGTLIYFLFRPSGATREERYPPPDATLAATSLSRAEQLTTLADLHDRGKLTDEEFAAEKAALN